MCRISLLDGTDMICELPVGFIKLCCISTTIYVGLLTIGFLEYLSTGAACVAAATAAAAAGDETNKQT
jgi:hypothetical protein